MGISREGVTTEGVINELEQNSVIKIVSSNSFFLITSNHDEFHL